LDAEWREQGLEVDRLRSEQKRSSKGMAGASPEQRAALVEQQRALKEGLKSREGRQGELRSELDRLLLLVPNIPSDDVPEGVDDSQNVELRRWGKPPAFDFEPRDHVALRFSPHAKRKRWGMPPSCRAK
jgi:seryl-tRNA synthetase